MLLSYRFVQEYVRLPHISAQDVANALTLSTVEIENVIDQAKSLDGVVVGKIIEVVKHPQADRLWICRVDIKTERLQIICGGSNVSKGMQVAVAKVGTMVRWHGEGEPIRLEKAKIRGIESNGMIASAGEIGLQRLFPASSEREIIDLSAYRLKVGQPLAKALGLTDVIFEINNKSMTHRPDLWGQYGLVREIAAIYKAKLLPLTFRPVPSPSRKKALSVVVKDPELCPRYGAVVMDNLSVQPSPWWLKRDLEALGVHSINSIVDSTSYVMLVLGQPLHAFDYDTIAGHTIVVEASGKKKSFSALNGKVYQISWRTLMIKDKEKNLALAGIVGGAGSEVTARTKTIVIESANFNASSIRRSEMALGLRTEASSRFEKKLDPSLVPQALAMVVELLRSIHKDARVASGVIDRNAGMEATPTIEVPKDFLDKRLGTRLDPKEVTAILKRLQFGVRLKKNTFRVSVPSFRARDVTLPEDVVEEVARLHGYGNIAPVLPRAEIAKPSRSHAARVEREIKNVLTRGYGYTEVLTYSFANNIWTDRLDLGRHVVTVKNAVALELSALRTSLLPGLLAKAAENLRWYGEFQIFELGRVFTKAVGEFSTDSSAERFLPRQPLHVAGLSVSKSTESEVYASVKAMLEQLLATLNIESEFRESQRLFAHACFDIRSHTTDLGDFGLLKSSAAKEFDGVTIVFWELQFETLAQYASFTRPIRPLPRYPSIVRDMAIVVAQETRWGDIVKAVHTVSPLLVSLELFDLFTSDKFGPSKKSLAFSMTFASSERTLESKEVDAIIAKVAKVLEDRFAAVVR